MPRISIKNYKLSIIKLKNIVHCSWFIVHCKKGFTLVEVLITIAIIGIISVVSIPALNKFNQNQDLDKSASDLKNLIQKAKSNAQSGVTCSDTHPSSSWTIEKNGTLIELHCLYKTFNPLDPIKNNTESSFNPSPATISYTCLPTASDLTAVSFDSTTYNSNSISLQGCQPGDTSAEIKLSKGSAFKVITVTSGGSVYEQ